MIITEIRNEYTGYRVKIVKLHDGAREFYKWDKKARRYVFDFRKEPPKKWFK